MKNYHNKKNGIVKTLNEIIDEYNNYSHYENNLWHLELSRNCDNTIEYFMEMRDGSDSWILKTN